MIKRQYNQSIKVGNQTIPISLTQHVHERIPTQKLLCKRIRDDVGYNKNKHGRQKFKLTNTSKAALYVQASHIRNTYNRYC